MSDDESPRFRVLFPRKCTDELMAMAGEAGRLGRKQEFEANLKELDYRLTCEADEWGEGREYLPVMKLQIRFGVVGLVTAWYGVNTDTRTVYVKEFRLHAGLK